ncbi:hypothetical protein MTR67_012647 [Solanum verrucosum]|uniref:Uncharacterized protein n=1 Tax=Solanum verrucosum TaxID=315347 RepID=A0AAF0QA74_SOLVR|nr:hypothetical protein MTR67_012647 [Solanum verrucosum]
MLILVTVFASLKDVGQMASVH